MAAPPVMCPVTNRPTARLGVQVALAALEAAGERGIPTRILIDLIAHVGRASKDTAYQALRNRDYLGRKIGHLSCDRHAARARAVIVQTLPSGRPKTPDSHPSGLCRHAQNASNLTITAPTVRSPIGRSRRSDHW